MNRATNPIWLCTTPGDVCARQLADQLGLATIVQNPRLVIFGAAVAPVNERAVKAALLSSGYTKYFENAFMPSDLAGPARMELVRSYFDVVSSTYGTLTRIGLNAACYEHLFDEAKRLTPKVESCLDFGCGPGTILGSSVAMSVPEVVGWDFSPRMRHLARSHKLPVLREIEFREEAHQFDLVLAAYVFHYGTVTLGMLGCIHKHLRIGGVLAANFHKNLGLEHFMSTSSQVPGLYLNSLSANSTFGSIAIFSRIS